MNIVARMSADVRVLLLLLLCSCSYTAVEATLSSSSITCFVISRQALYPKIAPGFERAAAGLIPPAVIRSPP